MDEEQVSILGRPRLLLLVGGATSLRRHVTAVVQVVEGHPESGDVVVDSNTGHQFVILSLFSVSGHGALHSIGVSLKPLMDSGTIPLQGTTLIGKVNDTQL